MASKTKVATWAGIAVLVIAFLLAGGTKLIGAEMHLENFERWGYPTWFVYVVGIAEVAGALLLIAGRTRFYGAAMLTGDMVGALGTHLIHAEWGPAIVPVLLGAIAAGLAWAHRPEGVGRSNAEVAA